MIDFDPYSLLLQDDPYPVYQQLRETCPVLHNSELEFWALSRYDDVKTALLQPRVYSSMRSLGEVSASDPSLRMPMMVVLDPPRHDELRALVNRAFTPRRIADLEARIRVITTELIDAFREQGRCDLWRDLAAPLPTIVIAELLGVPPEDREMFKEKSTSIASSVGPASTGPGARAAFDLAAYLAKVFEEKRKRPGDDLMSALLVAEIEGQRLTPPELVGFALLLLIAGNETTTNLISNGAVLLDRFPFQRVRLQANLGQIHDAVEEFLRFDPPVQGVERILTEDVVVRGEKLRKGEKVFLLLAAANRDEQWLDPDRFDIARNPNPHLSFGIGIHFCLGASLARLEARVAFAEILTRLPDFRVSGPTERLRSGIFRGLLSVPLAFDV